MAGIDGLVEALYFSGVGGVFQRWGLCGSAAVVATFASLPQASADDDPARLARVRVESLTRDAVRLERRGTRQPDAPEWQPICEAPCVATVAVGEALRLHLASGDTDETRIAVAGSYSLRVKPMDGGQLGGGILYVIYGGALVFAGLVLTGVSVHRSADGDPWAWAAAGAVASFGLGTTGLALGLGGIGEARSRVDVIPIDASRVGATVVLQGATF